MCMTPMTVKSLTENAELVTLLKRVGHGLSSSQIEGLETAIAEQQITNLRNGVMLPTACSPSVSAVFCWDTNDLQEESQLRRSMQRDSHFASSEREKGSQGVGLGSQEKG